MAISDIFRFGISQSDTSVEAQELTLGFRFGVYFFAGGVIPNPLDIRFQKVSGLGAEITTSTIDEGGQNLYSHRLPDKVSYNNLVLERGMVVGSALSIEFNATFSLFRFAPSNVLVTLFNEYGQEGDKKVVPVSAWLFMKAYPVKWSISDLDAMERQVTIESLELAYTRFQKVSL